MKSLKHLLVVVSIGILIQLGDTQPIVQRDAAEIELGLKKLNVVGTALYLAAHPDDENTALLAYLSKDQLVRTAYLSLTRGSGGQNLIGTEKGELLGVIRTEELLAARSIDGAEQYFTRAIDFGYSKSPMESLEKWGKDSVLSDVVWVIRKLRPDIIITRFTPELGGHGHHRASAMLALEAFKAAGDPAQFPRQLKQVETWQPKRIFWNTWRPAVERGNIDVEGMPFVDLGKFNTLLGKSYGEISAKSRSMHKSQGFGAGSRRGSYQEYLELLAGVPAENDIYQGVDLSWNRVPGSRKTQPLIEQVIKQFKPENPAASIPLLLEINAELEKLKPNFYVEQKQKEVRRLIRDCAGLWFEVTANNFSAVPGDKLHLNFTAVNRSDFPANLISVRFPFSNADSTLNAALQDNKPIEFRTTIRLPENTPVTQPIWLRKPPEGNLYRIDDQNLISEPVNPSPPSAKFMFAFDNQQIEYSIPVSYKWTDPVDGERYRPLEVLPPISIQLKNSVLVFPDNSAKEVTFRLKSHKANIDGNVKLSLPAGWQAKPAEFNFHLTKPEEEQFISATLSPPAEQSQGWLELTATTGNRSYTDDLVRIEYDHIPIRTVFQKSRLKLLKLNLKSAGKKIAYIMGSGDDIPDYLQQLGYEVTQLSDADLDTVNLKQFDTIIAGIRAYNTRERFPAVRNRLMEYVRDGGTYVVQYSTSRRLETDEIGPYPFEITHDRVSVEEAPVEFLQPNHPLLNFPNKITHSDFDGWVQERGLYFAGSWDDHYDTVIASRDPEEALKKGGMLYTSYGKGIFIYSGYSFFRQLPAGVPGAYRLFVNLISAGNANE